MAKTFTPDRIDSLPPCSIYETSVKGLNSQLVRLFPEKTLPVVQVQSQNSMREMARKLGNTLILPYIATHQINAETNFEGYNPFILRRQGYKLEQNGTKNFIAKLHAMPLKAKFEIIFVSQDINDINLFVQRWLTCSRFGLLNFQLQTGDDQEEKDTIIKIRIIMEPSVNYSDFTLETVGEINQMTANLEMHTYQGSIAKTPIIKALSLNLQSVPMSPTVDHLLDIEKFVFNDKKPVQKTL